jgi:protein SCO1/2
MSVERRPASRRVMRAALAGVAILLVIAGLELFVFGTPAPVQQAAAIGGPFTLTDGNGQTVTDQTYRGKYMLVYFGYTFCPDVCPTTLNDVAQAMDRLGPQADAIDPLFITVDPARDTADVVKQYAAAFSPRLQGLTGTPAQIATVAHEYRVYYAQHKTGPNPGDYTMDHSSILYLMNPAGQFIGIIRADEGADKMAADIKSYLSQA